MTPTIKRVALIPDPHCGDRDLRACELACKVLEDFKPHIVTCLGDVLDMPWASNFARNLIKEPGQLQRECNDWLRFALELNDATPGASRYNIPGNHDDRFITNFIHRIPALADFRGLSWDELLSAKETKWKHVEQGYMLFAGGRFAATHGASVLEASGASARKELRRWKMSGASGHSHRMGQVYETSFDGIRCWTECGHLSNNPPHYKRMNEIAPRDWQPGIVIMWVAPDEFRAPTLIPFWKRAGHYRTRYAEKEYTTAPRYASRSGGRR